ncbi:MAG: hypothetical protein ACETWM_02610 [Candidatus Lokiarchaeia archaeon]
MDERGIRVARRIREKVHRYVQEVSHENSKAQKAFQIKKLHGWKRM